MSSDTKKLIPILVIVGVLMCGCIALPVVGGLAMIGYLGARTARIDEGRIDQDLSSDTALPVLPEMPSDFAAPVEQPDLNAGAFNDPKQAAQVKMLAAEQRYLLAQGQYEAAQAVYEQQRNFNNAQAGRLRAQGVNVPPPQPPDPALAFEAEAARQAYEAAKAEYEALK